MSKKKKPVEDDLESPLVGDDIRADLDDDSGLWTVRVYTQGDWVEVATHCERDEADDCINYLSRWRRGIMKVGSLVFSTDQGLGVLAKSFFDAGVVTDVCTVAHGRRTEHSEWFPGAYHITNLRDGNQIAKVKAWMAGMDAMLFFETPFMWELLAFGERVNVRTFLMPMHECMPDPLPYVPTAFLCPSLLDLEWAKRYPQVPAFHIPVPVQVPFRQRQRAEVFVHNAGNGGLRGRNGTAQVIEAMHYVKSPIKLILRAQEPFAGAPKGALDSRIEFRYGTCDYDKLWNEGDVFLFPEKGNGLSLPLQEARAAGMLVMATNRFPINAWLPTGALIPVKGYQKARVSPRCCEFDEAIVDPRDIAATIDLFYGQDIARYSESGKAWAETMSWERLKPKYLRVLGG